MEKNVFNVRLAISSFEFLDNFAGICAIDLYNVSSLRSRSDECSVRVDCDGSDLCVVSWDNQVDTLINNYCTENKN